MTIENRPRVAQQLRGRNTPSGNPQRLWVISELHSTQIDHGDTTEGRPSYAHIIAIIDEPDTIGHILREWRCFELVSEDVPNSRIHKLRRFGRDNDCLFWADGTPVQS